MSLFILVVLLEIYTSNARTLARINTAELILTVAIVFTASAMARGHH